jgi:hypothetical protein
MEALDVPAWQVEFDGCDFMPVKAQPGAIQAMPYNQLPSPLALPVPVEQPAPFCGASGGSTWLYKQDQERTAVRTPRKVGKYQRSDVQAERNRASARACRLRKKNHIAALEDKLMSYERTICVLLARLADAERCCVTSEYL